MNIKNKQTLKGIKTFNDRLRELKLNHLDIIDENFRVNKKYKLSDEDGYLYYLSSLNLQTAIRRNGVLARFFTNNPYTYENINHHFKINNISLELLTKNPKDAKSKLEFKCLKHNEIFQRDWNQVYGGAINCSVCLGRNNYNLEMVKEIAKSKGCEFLSKEYKGICENYEFKCSCGNHFTRRLDVFIHSNRTLCWKCATGRHYYSYDYIKQELSENNVELLSGDYVNNAEDIEVRYECGCMSVDKMTNIRHRGYKCPHCTSKYISEIKISKYLSESNLVFNKQFSFEDLRGVGGGLLKFDFALKNNKNKIFLIEYDGEFHYHPIKGEEKFNTQQEHDRRKNEYCKLHDINLYRVPYWEKDNIIEKLEMILKKEGLK